MGKNQLELRQIQKQHTRKLIIFTILLTAILSSGCAFLNKEQGYVDDKPQNTPASWERNTFGVGF